jgi:hypothetical protein
MNWLTLGDYFFFVIHLLFIIFVLTGWMVYRWRRIHLAAVLLIVFSWFFLGIWYGWGFCPLTEWHWQILRRAGQWNLPSSYVAYLVQRTTGMNVQGNWIDILTGTLAFAALVLSVWVNFFRKRKGN